MSAKKSSPANHAEALPPTQAAGRPSPPPALAIHRKKCSICQHPQVLEIEQDLLDWVSSRDIARAYKLPSHSTVLHHAHARGLFERRQANLLGALDRIIQHAGEVKPTAGVVISAIRLSAELAREAASASASPQNGIVFALTGMPESDAVRPRHDAEKQNRPGAGDRTKPNGRPHR